MSPERRAAIVAWAKHRDALILEDDYDAEYRYDREPIGAIQGLAPDNVVYAGSASKTLAPGLRLGWLIAPPRLVGQIADMKKAVDRGSPSIEQLAFADFLAHGEFDRHLRRMRPVYRARRDALLRALRRHLPDVRPVGASAGLHVLAWLQPGTDEADVVERAREAGVNVEPLAPYWGDGGPPGLLFGYGGITEAAIDEGVRIIANAVRVARNGG
jgi:GntR family transcriptional regulator / MocR family aminotransferase